MRARSCFAIGISTVALLACDEKGSSLEITGARAFRVEDRRVAVEMDVVAFQRLGGNLGTYCAQALFEGEPAPVDQCATDLEDGDQKTIRLTSRTELEPNAAIQARVRVDAVDIGRKLVAPP